MDTLDLQKLYIGGQAVDARSGVTFETINPATGRPLASVQVAGADDVDRAVGAAREAFAPWSQTTGAARGRILRRAADLLRARRDELARIEVRDTGKPIAEAIAVDVDSGADCLEYFAGLAAGLHGEHVDLGPTAFGYTRREPLGVCVGIGAWNYPLQIACWKSAPALACGNAMVFKPVGADAAQRLEARRDLLRGRPARRACSTSCRAPRETGQALVRHPDGRQGVADRRGRHRQAGDGGRGRRTEAGHRSSSAASRRSSCSTMPTWTTRSRRRMMANFYTQGEVCSNGTRVFVERRAPQPLHRRACSPAPSA